MKDIAGYVTTQLDAEQTRMLTRLAAWHGQTPDAYLRNMTAAWVRLYHAEKLPLERRFGWWRKWGAAKATQPLTVELTADQFRMLDDLAHRYGDVKRWQGDRPGTFFQIITAQWLRNEHARLP